jgi:hypothetical protein
MKHARLFLLFVFCILSIPVQAQSNRDESETRSANPADRLGDAIERLVNRITDRWKPSDDEDTATQDTVEKNRQRSLTILDTETDDSAKTFSGDKVIEESDTINGDVVVKGGDLIVYGTINGSAKVVGGELRVKRTGKITGNARVVDGVIVKEPGAIIEGYEDKTNSITASYRTPGKRFKKRENAFDVPWSYGQSSLDNFIPRYNRVEGLFLGVGSEKKYYWSGERTWNAYGSIGWGFKSHTWRGNLGLSRQFAYPTDDGSRLFEVGVEGHSLTDTKDQWIIGQLENSLAAFLIHEDFRDYFERNGGSVYAAYYSNVGFYKTELRASYISDRYDSLTNKANWALFGGDKSFRPNPAVQPGPMRSVALAAGLSTITKTYNGSEGWSFYATSEIAKKSLGGDFDYDQYTLDIRRFQPLGRYDNFNIRMRVGTAGGPLPQQKIYEIGGLGTLNAFPFKSEIGNRMVLFNAEYIVDGNFLEELDFWPTWILHSFNFILLTDAGFTRPMAVNDSPFDGFDNITWSEFKHDFGVAIGNRAGSFRIGVAWRTDAAKPAQFILRITRPF